jgi:hypothetical protein
MSKRPLQASKTPRFHKGDEVVVCSEDEILATLDAEGKFEGLPFMPEMAKYCGRRFRVSQRVDKVFIDFQLYIARLGGSVLLEDLRCDGQAHDGCQMACRMLWKEAWLKRAASAEEMVHQKHSSHFACAAELRTHENGRYYCQATELREATTRLPWWYPRQYARALIMREATFRQLVGVLAASARRRMRRLRHPTSGNHNQGAVRPVSLGLQPGDLVEVRRRAEIEATLDGDGKNRGLLFTPEMSQYCGGRFRVLRRVERMIVEWTGEMRSVRDTVTLEDVTCRGIIGAMCPRKCHHLWREAWLKRLGDLRSVS